MFPAPQGDDSVVERELGDERRERESYTTVPRATVWSRVYTTVVHPMGRRTYGCCSSGIERRPPLPSPPLPSPKPSKTRMQTQAGVPEGSGSSFLNSAGSRKGACMRASRLSAIWVCGLALARCTSTSLARACGFAVGRTGEALDNYSADTSLATVDVERRKNGLQRGVVWLSRRKEFPSPGSGRARPKEEAVRLLHDDPGLVAD